jgi:hypothetical protein
LITSVTFVTHVTSVTSVTCSIRKFHQSKYISTSILWESIDQCKLKYGISEFVKALHSNKYEVQQKMLSDISQTELCDEISLNEKTPADFPTLQQYRIQMVKACIQSVLRDIY